MNPGSSLSPSWTLADRERALERASLDKPEAHRHRGRHHRRGGRSARCIAARHREPALERGDFAGGASSATSKMIHGGLRYIAEGQLGVTRESCVERDLMARLNPNLVAPLPFLFCSFDDGVAPWKMIAGLSILQRRIRFQTGSFKLLKGRDRSAEPRRAQRGDCAPPASTSISKSTTPASFWKPSRSARRAGARLSDTQRPSASKDRRHDLRRARKGSAPRSGALHPC